MLKVPDKDAPAIHETGGSPHAVVVGSGFGGLAAAIRLGARGFRVTVLEKLDRPGGRAYVYHDDGFVFDAGPTVITAPFLLDELWALAGAKVSDDVEIVPVYPFYRIRFHDGETFDYSDDEERMDREIARFEPRDVDGFRRLLTSCEKIYRIGFERLVDVPFSTPLDMARIVPHLLALRCDRSVYAHVSAYLRNERLRRVFSFHPLLVGGNPLKITSMYSLIMYLERHGGVHFAMGGTNRLVDGMVRLVEERLGGTVRCEAEVDEILVEGGAAKGVRLKSGEIVRSDIVVSNADSAYTYKHLVPSAHRRRWTDAKLDAAKYSMGLFVWYFGTDRTYPDVAHHTILLSEDYKGLLTDIFDRKILSDEFSLYLHRPTATDPSMAPAGCDAFYVLSPVPHLQSGVDWTVTAEPYRKRIEAFLAATILPGLDRHVVTSHLLTPLDFRDRLNSIHGAGFGLQPLLLQSAWFRPPNRSEEVGNLYLVGAGTHPGAGLPGVISSAKVLDRVGPHPATFR